MIRLLLVLASLGASPTALAGPPAPPRFTWPNPDMIEAAEVPGVVRALGVPMKLKLLRVRHPVEEMVDVYLEAFQRAGLYIPPPAHQLQLTRELTLVALDPERLISYTVIFQPNRDGTTSLLLGESNLALRGPPPEEEGPLFPGARGVLRSDQEGARVVTYSVKARPEEVRSFYRELLGKAGYVESDDKLSPGVFSRQGEQLQLLVRPGRNDRLSVTLISRTGPSEGSPDDVQPVVH